MNQVNNTKKEWKKKFKMPKLTRKIIIFTAVVCIAAGGCFYGYNRIFATQKSAAINTAEVTTGSITVAIEGSGTIEPAEMYEITSLATGEILKSDFEEGQDVNKGDLLYVIDTKDIDNTIEKAKVSLEKQELSHSEALKTYEGLNVTAPISGVITQNYVKEGDSVQNGSKIADIINDSWMMLEIPFNSDDASNISLGDTANVILENSFYETTGTVEYISSGSLVNESGAAVSTVKIKVANLGSITSADRATAVVNQMACNTSGTFDYIEKKTVTSQASGDVNKINYETGDKVNAGSVLISIESQNAEVSYKQSELSMKDSQLALQNAYDQLDDYNITSPISGTVIQKTSKAGDTLDSTTKSTAMAVIADMSSLSFEINVDELDIGKVEAGQEVEVTADSLTGQVFKGRIDNVSAIGTSKDGVATYPVKVVIEDSENLMIGMNVNATIVIESKENVLKIPSSALLRGNKVLVEDKDGSKVSAGQQKTDSKIPGMQAVPAGYAYVSIEVGINDDDYVEILGGLEEGDKVVVQEESSSSKTQGMNQMPAGGMPSGGMPGGSMPSSGQPR